MKNFSLFKPSSIIAIMMIFFQNSSFGTVNITGPTNVFCTGLSVSYGISWDEADEVQITLEGGIFPLTPFFPTTSCSFTEGGPVISSTRVTPTFWLIRGFDMTNCLITLPVLWNASGTRTIKAVITEGGSGTKTLTINNTPPSCSITGPIGPVCKTMTSGFYNSNSVGGPTTHSWTATSTGAPVSIQCTTCLSTNITGFTPNNMYSITHRIYCPGSASEQSYCTATVLTIVNCTGLQEPDNNTDIEAEMEFITLEDEDRVIVIGDEENFDATNPHVIGQKEETSEINIYPNPVKRGARLFLLIPDSAFEKSSVRVYDTQGKMLDALNQNETLKELETANYPAGMYYVQFVVNGKSETRKFSIIE